MNPEPRPSDGVESQRTTRRGVGGMSVPPLVGAELLM